MKARAISGHGVKGPACFLVEMAGLRLLLDLGIGPDDDRKPELSGVGRIDAVLVSHAHADHVGALDLLPAVGGPPIFATALVAELGDLHRFGPVHTLPLNGEADVLGLPVLTGRDGHAPGGIWMRIGGPGGLLYTGDFSTESQLYPFDPFPEAATLIFDASYGSYDGALEVAQAALMAHPPGEPLLLPAPAGGRGLEMAMRFAARNRPIGLDQSHRALAAKLIELPGVLCDGARPQLTQTIAAARALDAGSEPGGAAIAADANATAGTSRMLLDEWAGRPEVRIVFTGHRAAGTPSEALVDSGRASFLRWNVHPRLADLEAMLAAVRPERAMPAFLLHADLPALIARLGSHTADFVAEFA